ncbi:MAG TPA: NAD(P)-dependent oxidoreductase [Gaiellaceae bacterium]
MSVAVAPSVSPPTELRPPFDHDDALLEADRCLACSGPYAVAPCTLACPAQVDVPAFIDALACDDVLVAAQTIFAENILGGTCARVCPVEVLCEAACVLVHDGQKPIQIAALQRYATDWALMRDVPLRSSTDPSGHSVAVVGAGPAGLACAGELAARGHAVTVFEGRKEIGGLARFAIAPYRIERAPLPAEQRALEALGVRFRLGAPVSCVDELANYDAVFLGVGLGDDVPLGLPGDELTGVWESLPFIEALKDGVLHDVGDRVIVIGGGNTAIDVARESLRLGATHVTVVYRRTRAEMPAYAFEVEEAEDEGVKFAWRTLPVRFLGPERVMAVECVSVRPGPPDADGRRRPLPVAGSEFDLHADTVVKAIGQQPRPELSARFGGLELDDGKVVIDDEGCTTNRRVFAGGDAVNGGASVVEAVRQGKRAALAIDRSLG